MEQQLHGLDNRITALYEEKSEGLILPEDFYCLINEIEIKRKEVEQRLAPILRAIREAEIIIAEQQNWTPLIKEKSPLDEIERNTLECLIDRIEVGARESTNNLHLQEIKIYYRFANVQEISSIQPSLPVSYYPLVP